MNLPYSFPLRAISAPKTAEIGHHFLRLLELLWNAPVEEVRKACLSAIKDGDYQSNTYKAFQSNTKDLEENHLLVQRSVCALVLQYDTDVVVRLLESYIEHAYKALQSDRSHVSWRDEDDGIKLASEVMFYKAVRFATRLLVIKNPGFVRFGKLDSNSLYCSAELLHVLLHGRHSAECVLVVSVAAGRCLWRRICKGHETLDEERWQVFEELFRFSIESAGKLHYGMLPYHRYMRKIAQLIRNDGVAFMTDRKFGPVLELRARHICQEYLRAESIR